MICEDSDTIKSLMLSRAYGVSPHLEWQRFPQSFLDAFQSSGHRHRGGQNSLDGC